MQLLEGMRDGGHELVLFRSEPEAGYRGIVAVHDTTLGPSMGGTRFWNYATEAEALADVLRLSRAMTYKSAMAGIDLGGGKSVILGDPARVDREALFRAHGRAVEALGGRYYAAEDVGTTAGDMAVVREETRFVTGLPGRSGEPAPLTALGTFEAMRACAIERWGDPSLEGRHVAVQGVGQVGARLCELLAAAGARLTVADVVAARVERLVASLGARAADPASILEVPADILAPCALGPVLDAGTIPRLRVSVVVGAANDQLDRDERAEALRERGIVHAPDFVANAGGILSVYGELKGWAPEEAQRRALGIHETTLAVFREARARGETPVAAARRMAEARIAAARAARSGGPGGSLDRPHPPSSSRDTLVDS